MPLLCISLLALLLLPLSLSCDSNRPPEELRNDYMLVQTHLDQTVMETLQRQADKLEQNFEDTADMAPKKSTCNIIKESITTLLQNEPCMEPKHKPRSCMSNITNVVSTLHILTCKMKNLNISHTEQLVKSVLSSMRCPCPERPTKDSKVNLGRRRRTTRPRRHEHRRRETRKLCKAMVFLTNITECYQLLNTRLVHN